MQSGNLFYLVFLVTTLVWILSTFAYARLLSYDARRHHTITVKILTILSVPAIICIGIACYIGFSVVASAVLILSLLRSMLKGCVRIYARIRALRWWFSTSLLVEDDVEHQLPKHFPRTATCKPGFCFLDLPVEIRNLVYRSTVEHYDDLDCRPSLVLRPRKQFGHAMALIRTCRQIRSEARDIVFSSTLFHVWSRYPFYRHIKPCLWTIIREIHLAAQPNHRGESKLRSVLRDLRRMLSLQDLYVSIGNYQDFHTHYQEISTLFSDLRRALKRLALIQINVISPRYEDGEAEYALKRCLLAANGTWPTKRDFGLLQDHQGRKTTRWRAYVKLPGHQSRRKIGGDEENLVRCPWDGETF